MSALQSPIVGQTASTPTLVGSTCAVRTFFWRTTLGLVCRLFATTMCSLPVDVSDGVTIIFAFFPITQLSRSAYHRTAKVWLLALIVTPPHSQNTIARCSLRLSAFPVSSWLLVRVEEVVVMWLLSRNAYGMDGTRWLAEPLHGKLVRSVSGDTRGHGAGVVKRTVWFWWN